MADRQCKNDYIRIRCTPKFKALMKKDAKERDMTLSELIIKVLTDYHLGVLTDRLKRLYEEE